MHSTRFLAVFLAFFLGSNVLAAGGDTMEEPNVNQLDARAAVSQSDLPGAALPSAVNFAQVTSALAANSGISSITSAISSLYNLFVRGTNLLSQATSMASSVAGLASSFGLKRREASSSGAASVDLMSQEGAAVAKDLYGFISNLDSFVNNATSELTTSLQPLTGSISEDIGDFLVAPIFQTIAHGTYTAIASLVGDPVHEVLDYFIPVLQQLTAGLDNFTMQVSAVAPNANFTDIKTLSSILKHLVSDVQVQASAFLATATDVNPTTLLVAEALSTGQLASVQKQLSSVIADVATQSISVPAEVEAVAASYIGEAGNVAAGLGQGMSLLGTARATGVAPAATRHFNHPASRIQIMSHATNVPQASMGSGDVDIGALYHANGALEQRDAAGLNTQTSVILKQSSVVAGVGAAGAAVNTPVGVVSHVSPVSFVSSANANAAKAGVLTSSIHNTAVSQSLLTSPSPVRSALKEITSFQINGMTCFCA